MKIIKIQTLKAIVLLALGSLATVFAGDKVETANIALYQPDNVLVERKVAPEDLAAYIQKLTKILEDQIGADAKKEALDVVVMVRPEKKVRVWFVSSLASPESREPLAKMLEDVVPVEIVGGPMAFAISLNIAGATREGEFSPPIPTEWAAAANAKGDSVRIPEGIVDAVWENPAKSKK